VERYRPKHVNRALQQQMMADSAMDVDDDLTLGDSKLGASKHAIDVGQLLIQSIPPMIQITPAIKQQIIGRWHYGFSTLHCLIGLDC